jgi:histone H3/H4
LNEAPSRASDIYPIAEVEDDNEPTFVFSVPERESLGAIDPMQEDDGQDQPTIVLEVQSPSDKDLSDDSDTDEEEVEMLDSSLLEDTTLQDPEPTTTMMTGIKPSNVVKKKKEIRVSDHNIPYPSLPTGVVKKLATTFARTGGNSKAKINKDTLAAVMKASDWFFEQVSNDLGAYANHAGRKTIDESDVVTLMRRYVLESYKILCAKTYTMYRQRQINATTTPFSLAQRHLPRELLQELRMAPPPKLKRDQYVDRGKQ